MFKKMVYSIAVMLLVMIFSMISSGCDSGGDESEDERPSGYVTDHVSSLVGPVEEVWVVRYNHPNTEWDEARDIAIDALGNSYILGIANQDPITIKYDSTGQKVWIAQHESDGTPLWIEHFSDGAIALDQHSDIYVTLGTSDAEDDSLVYTTIKYNSEGNALWTEQYQRSVPDYSLSSDITLDSHDNVYITGESMAGSSTAQGFDYTTLKYDSEGQLLWTAHYETLGEDHVGALALTIDRSGNIYVTGPSGTVKYDNNGIEIWTLDCATPGDYQNSGESIIVDELDNIYIAGKRGTSKYDSLGNQLWSDHFDRWESVSFPFREIALDRSGNLYVSGPLKMSDATDERPSSVTIKYDTNGNRLWTVSEAGYIIVDDSGDLYIATAIYGGYLTKKYDGDGNQIWAAELRDRHFEYSGVSGIALDKRGSVFVTGTGGHHDMTQHDEPWYDILTVKYTQE